MSEINENAASQVSKRYLEPFQPDIQGIKSKMYQDSVKDSSRQRFGFFSVMHSNFMGDEYYSAKKNIKKDASGKVPTSPRGIYTKASKKGKFIDSYFDAGFIREDRSLRDVIEKKSKEDLAASLEKVKKSKEKGGNFKASFKPAGVKEYKDSLYPDNMNYKIPIWKEEEKGSTVDFKSRQVHNEKRGIYTQNSKSGNICYKGVLFSYEGMPRDLLNKYNEMKKQELEKQIEMRNRRKHSKEFKKPFLPNNVSKCDTFVKDKDLYGLDNANSSRLKAYHESMTKKSSTSPARSAKHEGPFKPSSMTKSVILL